MATIKLRWLALALVFTLGLARADEPKKEENNSKLVAELRKKATDAVAAGKHADVVPAYEAFLVELGKSKLSDGIKKREEMSARYNLACSHAVLGKKDKALDELAKSIDLGFKEWKHLDEDKDFASIKDDEAFKKVVAAGKEKEQKALDAEPKLPFNPFEKAKVGDWSAFRGKISGTKKLEGKTVLVWTVTAVEGTKVTVGIEQSSGGRKAPPKKLVFDTATVPTLRAYCDFTHGEELVNIHAEDAKETRDGKEFSCKKVSFDAKIRGATAKTTLLLAPEVAGSGRVSFVSHVVDKDQEIDIAYDLGGYGSKDATAWGKAVADLEKE